MNMWEDDHGMHCQFVHRFIQLQYVRLFACMKGAENATIGLFSRLRLQMHLSVLNVWRVAKGT